MYLLDTDTCINILNDRSSLSAFRLSRHNPSEIRLCSVVKAELIYGAWRSNRVTENMRSLRSFFAPLMSIGFDDRCAEEYGVIKAELSRQGMLIGPNDLLIASIAKANGLILVTHNVSEFSRVPGLRIEDWET